MNNLKKNSVFVGVWLACIMFHLAYIPYNQVCGDEPFSIFHAAMAPGEIISELLKGNNPPVYEVLLHYWTELFGYGKFSVRSFSVLLMSIGWLAFIPMSKALNSKRLLIVLPIVFTFTELLFTRNIEARMYPLLFALVTWSWAAFMQLKNTREWKWLFVLSITAGLTVYVHYLGVFHILALGVVSIFFLQIQWWKKLIAIVVTASVAFPILYTIFSKTSEYQNDHWLEIAFNFKNVTFFGFMIFNHLLVVAILVLGWFLILFVFRTQVGMFRGKVAWALLTYFIIAYGLMWGATIKNQPVILDRYLGFIAVATALLVALSFDVFWQGRKWLAGITMLLYVVVFDFTPWNNRNCEDWSRSADLKQPIVISPPWYQLTFVYHRMPELLGTHATKIDSILRTKNVYPIYGYDEIPKALLEQSELQLITDQTKADIEQLLIPSFDTVKVEEIPEIFRTLRYHKKKD